MASKWHHGLVRSDYSENWSCGNKCGRIPNHFCNTDPKNGSDILPMVHLWVNMGSLMDQIDNLTSG